MACGMVAEKNSVWRSFGSFDTILRMSLMKPMSSMRSASSRTRQSTCRQTQRVALHEIEQTSRCRHQNIDAVHQRAHLRAHRHAADGERRGDMQMTAIGLNAVEDLRREFARRAQDQRAAGLFLQRQSVGSDAMQDRQREGGRLAGAGLGDADDVLAGDGDGIVWAWIGVGMV